MINPNFFFIDGMDDERNYISVAIGDVWLYFYKENLIGVRDMHEGREAFLNVGEPGKPDGYSHRHEITEKTMDLLFGEPYYQLNKGLIKRLSADELTAVAITWVSNGLVTQVDQTLCA